MLQETNPFTAQPFGLKSFEAMICAFAALWAEGFGIANSCNNVLYLKEKCKHGLLRFICVWPVVSQVYYGKRVILFGWIDAVFFDAWSNM